MLKFFFMGNCQARYAAAAFAGCEFPDTDVYVIGPRFPSNASFRGKAPTYITRDDAMDMHMASGGATFVGMLQETPLQKTSRITGPLGDIFSHVVYFPHLQFRTMWPTPEEAENAKRLSRRWHIERVSLAQTFKRSNLPEGFFDRYIEENGREVFFHTHSHPTGRAFGFVWRGIAGCVPEPLQKITAAAADLMNDSPGIDVNSKHPVATPVADALGVSWHASPQYKSITEIEAFLKAKEKTWFMSPETTIELVRSSTDIHYVSIVYRALRSVRMGELAGQILMVARERYPNNALLESMIFREACSRNDEALARESFKKAVARPFMSVQDERRLLRLLDLYHERPWLRALVDEAIQDPATNHNVMEGLKTFGQKPAEGEAPSPADEELAREGMRAVG